MEGRRKDSRVWKCAVVKVREARRNWRRNPKGREGEISEAWKTKSIKTKSDRAKDI